VIAGLPGWAVISLLSLSSQVVPTLLEEFIRGSDPERSQRVMKAIMQMGKIEIEPLRRAYEGTEEPAPTRS
jgi:hypothetical protein